MHGMRIGAGSGDRARGCDFHRPSGSTVTTFEADLNGHLVIFIRRRTRVRSTHATRVAHTLRANTYGAITLRRERAIRGHLDIAALSARTALASDRNVQRTLGLRSHIEHDFRRREEIAHLTVVRFGVTATTANALREDRRCVVTLRAHPRRCAELSQHRRCHRRPALRRPRGRSRIVLRFAPAPKLIFALPPPPRSTGRECRRSGDRRFDRADVRHIDAGTMTRITASAANGDDRLLAFRSSGGAHLDDEIHAGIAATTTHRLGRETVGCISLCLQQTRLVDPAHDRHSSRITAATSAATETDSNGIAGGREHAGDVDATVAAATTDALRQDAVTTLAHAESRLRLWRHFRAVRICELATVDENLAVTGDGDRTGIRAKTAFAADADRRGVSLAERCIPRDVEPTVAATACNTLREQPDRTRTIHVDRAFLNRADVTALVTGTAEATEVRETSDAFSD